MRYAGDPVFVRRANEVIRAESGWLLSLHRDARWRSAELYRHLPQLRHIHNYAPRVRPFTCTAFGPNQSGAGSAGRNPSNGPPPQDLLANRPIGKEIDVRVPASKSSTLAYAPQIRPSPSEIPRVPPASTTIPHASPSPRLNMQNAAPVSTNAVRIAFQFRRRKTTGIPMRKKFVSQR